VSFNIYQKISASLSLSIHSTVIIYSYKKYIVSYIIILCTLIESVLRTGVLAGKFTSKFTFIVGEFKNWLGENGNGFIGVKFGELHVLLYFSLDLFLCIVDMNIELEII
jgi:hypothetical protein